MWLWLPIIIFFILDYIKIAEWYKFNISLAILCIAIPRAWFKSWKKLYKKFESDLPEEYKNFLKQFDNVNTTNIDIKTNDKNTLSMIKELVDDGYMTDYKYNYNNNTKSYQHRIKLTTKWKKHLEGRL